MWTNLSRRAMFGRSGVGLLAVGLGRFSGRNKQAKRLTKKVEAKYNAPATAVGHSLGDFRRGKIPLKY